LSVVVIIDRLIGKNGDVRTLLGKKNSTELLDISDDAWADSLEILGGLRFLRVRLAETEITANFVNCTFESSEFQRLHASAHFWAGENHWQNCLFDSVTLEEAISPLNTFLNCRFNRTTITNYKAYQTLFDGCLFEDCQIAGLRAELVTNRNHQNPDLSMARANLQFRNCTFNATRFEECFFEKVGFEKCFYEAVQAHACDFSGVITDQKWWGDQISDPFTMLLMKVLELIHDRCGEQSAAYSAMQNYLLDYKTGRTRSQDFSACLYTGKVPDEELDRIEDELPKVMAKYPF